MKESSFSQNSRFKALSDEDLFIEEAEPLNNVSFSFKYWYVYAILRVQRGIIKLLVG